MLRSRSLEGCTYHVSHPGGLTYDRFPVNTNEAEARRASRFAARGEHPGLGRRQPPGSEAQSLEYPLTLGLRRATVPRGRPALKVQQRRIRTRGSRRQLVTT